MCVHVQRALLPLLMRLMMGFLVVWEMLVDCIMRAGAEAHLCNVLKGSLRSGCCI